MYSRIVVAARTNKHFISDYYCIVLEAAFFKSCAFLRHSLDINESFLNSRTQGLSFASLLARVGCTTSPFIAEVLKLVYSSLPFLIMGVLSLIAGFTSFCLPDTNGDSSRELQGKCL